MLNAIIPNELQQKQFFENWKEKYKKHIVDNNPEERYLWNIRTHKALKETFASAQFFCEAQVAKKTNSWASFYFSSYYSLFHAFLSCVTLMPNHSIEKLSEITHVKLKNVFRDTFCMHKFKIIDESIVDTFSILKYMREYYSYHLPPNEFLYNHDDNVKPDVILPNYLRACFQLANLLSLIIELSFEKHGKELNRSNFQYSFVHDNFCMLNCQKHPISNSYILHYVDRVRLEETFKYPAPIPLIIELEHYSDEFGLYDKSGFPTFPNGDETSPSAIVYKSIL